MSEIKALYRQRWSIEVLFRSLKQTLGKRTLRAGTPALAACELDWALVGLWMLGLLTLTATGASRAGRRRAPGTWFGACYGSANAVPAGDNSAFCSRRPSPTGTRDTGRRKPAIGRTRSEKSRPAHRPHGPCIRSCGRQETSSPKPCRLVFGVGWHGRVGRDRSGRRLVGRRCGGRSPHWPSDVAAGPRTGRPRRVARSSVARPWRHTGCLPSLALRARIEAVWHGCVSREHWGWSLPPSQWANLSKTRSGAAIR